MRAFFGFIQIIECATGNNHLAMFQIMVERALEREHAWFAIQQSEHLHRKCALQGRVFKELVEHFSGLGAAFEFNNDTHTFTVGFVAHIRNSVQATFAHQFSDAFNQTGFVELVGDFVDDDGIASFADFFNDRFPTHRQMPTTGAVCLANAFGTDNDTTGGEIGPWHVLHEFFHADFFNVIPAVNQQIERGNQLAQVVGRDVGRHTHRDTAGAIHQQVRYARGQDFRFLERCVEIVHKVNRVFVQISDEFIGDFVQPGFGVTHGGRRVAVD